MKKTPRKKRNKVEAEPMPEFDFSNGVRGKYYAWYQEGVRAGTIKRRPRVAGRPTQKNP